jgi:hypothetical protein
MSSPTIRPAVAEDARAILELWRLAGAFPSRTDNEESVCSLIATRKPSLSQSRTAS